MSSACHHQTTAASNVPRNLGLEWRRKKCRLARFLTIIAIITTAGSAAPAQVLTPVEIRDPDMRALQQQYINDLKAVGQDIQGLRLKYHFYLNRKLDLDE